MRTTTLERSRMALSIVWLTGFLLPFLILSLRTYFGTYYAGKETEAWSWFSPNIVPTIGVILATLAVPPTKRAKAKEVSLYFFLVTLVLSTLYVGIFNLIFILEPLSSSPPLDIFKRSSLFLGVAQGFVTVTLAAFFLKNANT